MPKEEVQTKPVICRPIEYVLNFLFSPDMTKVAMIRKERPEWQAGKLNGIGGKVESQELARDAAIREFAEETGVYIDDWTQFGRMECQGKWIVYCFTTVGDVSQVRTRTDEQVGVFLVSDLREEKTIENILWLVPLAIGHLERKEESFHVTYRKED